jgi:energy-converting hydrogenase Eha subunit A
MRAALTARAATLGGQLGGATHLPRPWMINRRALGLLAVSGVAAAFVAYMVVNVPLEAPTLSRSEVTKYWWAAALAASIVAAGVTTVVILTLQARRAAPAQATPVKVSPGRPLIPRSLRFEFVPRWTLATAATISLVGAGVAFAAGARLWIGGLVFLLPWLPLVALEAKWKYARYGIFAAFALLVLLQVLHMGEHTMQVGQLYVHRGDLAQSHGVFGQLDFELVHFLTDTMLWINLGLLLILFRGRNTWLWIAFAAASLHQIEHFYLFWIYQVHPSFYAQGGFAGIMGQHGLIGSPLDRPYLHFTYNLIVVVPMVIALWDAAREADEQPPKPARA